MTSTAETPLPDGLYVERPDVSHLITEDDTPVDNIYSDFQHRLLVESLYSSWKPGSPFLAATNVGVFSALNRPPIVPDVFVSMDVAAPPEPFAKEHRSYFLWEFGKPPEIVVEVVSNREGGELDRKLQEYARIGVDYYAVFDPCEHLRGPKLRTFVRHGGSYILLAEARFERPALGLIEWRGTYENWEGEWLRWTDEAGNLILTGAENSIRELERANRATELADQEAERANQEAERANQEAERANQETERANQETERANQEAARANQEAERANLESLRAMQEAERADQEAERAERLLAKLRAAGIDPEA